jgi:RNA polymerase sigma factor (sigma-70 family)
LSESEALVQKLIKGDVSVFAAIVDLYQDMVYNTALSIVQNEADADDITQEVFVQVHISVSSFKGDSKFSTWLYQITISKALDHEKKKKRKKRFGFVQSLFGNTSYNEPQLVEFHHPGIQLEQKENAARLFNALKKIPEKQRIAFTLHKIEGQTYAATAAIMQVSVEAVESLLARAKANMKKELTQIFSERKH